MPTLPVLKARGLHLANNQFSAVPEGSMARARNCVIPFKDVLESRRGQALDNYTFGINTDRGNEGFFFENTLVQQYGLKLARDTGSAWVDYAGSYSPPDASLLRMKFAVAARNLYFNTNAGIYVLDAVAGTPILAGSPQGNRSRVYPWSANGTWLSNDTAVAYRHTWCRKDVHGQVKEGAPSGRAILRNAVSVPAAAITRSAPDGSHPAGKVTIDFTSVDYPFIAVGDNFTISPGEGDFPAGLKTAVTVVLNSVTYNEAGANVSSTLAQFIQMDRGAIYQAYFPPGVTSTSGHFLRVYRSHVTDPTDLDPDDELFQVFEVVPTGPDYAAGYVQFNDTTPESQLGKGLYTNPNTGDGIGSANLRPPIGKDICVWDGRTWYANTTDKHRLSIELLGIGAPGGVQNGDILLIAGRTYTFQYPASAAPEGVLIFTAGTPEQNVHDTTVELCRVINANPNNTLVTAYYASGPEDPTGKVLLEERAVGGPSFTVFTDRPSGFSPASLGVPGQGVSDNDRKPNGLAYSKRGLPEAVPAANRLPIGDDGLQILRCIALRDKMIVMVEPGGAAGFYAVSGNYPYRIDPIDSTTTLLAPDTAKLHNNQIYGLTTQGVAAITDSGVRIISTEIESELLTLLGAAPVEMKLLSFGVSYETDRQYQLWLPTAQFDTCCNQAFVFNSRSDIQNWTQWDGPRSWGAVHPRDNRLYLADGATNKVRRERKNYNRTDFVDESFHLLISSFTGKSVVLSSVVGIAVGDMLFQTDSTHSLVTAIDEDTNTVTVVSTENWLAGDADIQVAIDNSFKWVVAAPNGPSWVKRFRNATLHFRSFYVNSFLAYFDSDNNTTESIVELSTPGFGLVPFGGAPFGLEIGQKNVPAEVPPQHQESCQIRVGCSIREAWAIWSTYGYSLNYELVGDLAAGGST